MLPIRMDRRTLTLVALIIGGVGLLTAVRPATAVATEAAGDIPPPQAEPMPPEPDWPIHPGLPIIVPFFCLEPDAPGAPPPPPGTPPAPPGATPTPWPSPTPGGRASAATYQACPQLAGRVPQQVQQNALAQPWRLYGYGLLRNPNVPHHPLWNPLRTWVTIRDYGKPWSRCNPLVIKAGCP